MSLSQYLLGAAELAAIVAALGFGAHNLRAMLVPGWSGTTARLAELILGISGLIVVSELLGLAGLLKEAPLVIACVAAGLGAGRWARGRMPEEERPQMPPVGGAAVAVAVAVSALVIVHWALPTQEALRAGMYFQDTTWYHMSFSGRFAQTGEIWPLHFTDPLKLVAWFYPQNSELLHGIGMVAFDTDFLSPLVNIAFAALTLLAAWCVGRPYAVGATAVVGAAVVLDSEMILGSQAGNAPNDVMGLFFLLAAIAFLVTGWRSDGGGGHGVDPEAPAEPDPIGAAAAAAAPPPTRLAGIGTGPIVLAGLAAGLGIGTKTTLVPVLGILTLGLLYLAGSRRDAIRAQVWWLGAMALTGGFWYLRNVWFAQNPVPQIEKAGPVNLPGPDQVPELYPRDPHSLSEYYNDPGVWRDSLFPVLDDRLGPLWPLLMATVVFGLVLALFRGGDKLMRVLAVTGLIAGLAYVFTPLTASGGLGNPTGFDANLRYVAPPLLVGLVLIPLIPALRRGNRPWIVAGLFGLLLAQGTITSADWDGGTVAAAVVLVAALVAVPAALLQATRGGRPAKPVLLGGALAFVALVAIGRGAETSYIDGRYDIAIAPQLEGKGFRASDSWPPIQQFGKQTVDSRIAVVGRAAAFGQYHFYGDDLSNWVQYIGLELNRGTFRRIGSDCELYRRVVNEGDYDFVVSTPRIGASQEGQPQENVWTSRDPNSKLVVRGGPARIYALSGPLDPAGCEQIRREAERRTAEAKREKARKLGVTVAELPAALERLREEAAAEAAAEDSE